MTHRAKYRPAVLVLGCMLCLLAAAAPFADCPQLRRGDLVL